MKPFKLRSISVLGLGKLGAPMAACFAAKGYEVIGVDLDSTKVNAMNRLEALVYETGLQEMLNLSSGRLSATSDVMSAVLETDATFIVIDTPSDPDGTFSLRNVIPACETIGNAIKDLESFHLVVLTSTVMPGAANGPVREAIERSSGKRCGKDFGLCYSPEFIALGDVIQGYLNPDFVLIGESDERSGKLLEEFYKRVCENTPAIARMNTTNAELTKIAVNTYVTTKISFANMLAHVCECLPGGDVDIVTTALGLDSRIGSKYLKGAVGYGGPCFPRDNIAFAALAKQHGVTADVAEAAHKANQGEVLHLSSRVLRYLPDGGTVGILGLSYKPDTDVIIESQGMLLAQHLVAKGVSVVAYDPAAMENASRILVSGVCFANSTEDCIRNADVIVIPTAWKDFQDIEGILLDEATKTRAVIDCWRILIDGPVRRKLKYHAPGLGMIL